MKKVMLVASLLVITSLNNTYSQVSQTQPKYANDGSKKLIEKMIEAHGGWEKWASMPVVSFTKMARPVSQDGKLPYDPWITIETVNKKTEQVYLELPLDNAYIVSDGKRVKSEGLSASKQSAAPDSMLSLMTYRFSNMPWLTQRSGVKIGPVEQRPLPNETKKYHAIRVDVDSNFGFTISDFYMLFIDPETYQLKGVGFQLQMGKFVPGGPTGPPMVHKFTEYSTVDGVTYPTQYKSFRYNTDPNYDMSKDQVVGATHDIWNWNHKVEFNLTQLNPNL